MKKLLFVINTLSKAGAEVSLLEFLRNIDSSRYDVDLYVMMNQGELIDQVPEYVHVINKKLIPISVLSGDGRKYMILHVIKSAFRNAAVFKNIPYMLRVLCSMLKNKRFQMDKLIWKIISDGAQRISGDYDAAIAFIEGASAYFVAEHIKADKKIGIVHVDYKSAGYDRFMDKDCYTKFDSVFTVSKEIQKPFYEIYPELAGQVQVFENMIDIDRIQRLSHESENVYEKYAADDCFKIMTCGRLTKQKAYEISIGAMAIIRDKAINAKWFVLGDGSEREYLDKLIKEYKLEDNFILLGAVDNPYPWFRECDLYVHCSRFEGKSMAIREALILGCPAVVSDCSGNRELIENGVNGLLCELDSEKIANVIEMLIKDDDKRKSLSEAAIISQQSRVDSVGTLLGNI